MNGLVGMGNDETDSCMAHYDTLKAPFIGELVSGIGFLLKFKGPLQK